MLNKIAHCYDIEKNFKYSTFNWYLTTRMSTTTNRQNKSELFSPYFSEITNYSSSSFWGIKSCFYHRNSSAFLLHNSKIFSNVKLFSIFSQTFLELIFATKIKTMLLKQSAVLFTSCQKNIAYIMCLNT